MKRTYVDSGVLVMAARGSRELSGAALDILCDPEREFVSSILVRLEVMPRASTASEAEFYEAFFRDVAIWARLEAHLLVSAVDEARSSGVSPADAIHVLMAASTGCHELVIADEDDAPIYATKRVAVVGVG